MPHVIIQEPNESKCLILVRRFADNAIMEYYQRDNVTVSNTILLKKDDLPLLVRYVLFEDDVMLFNKWWNIIKCNKSDVLTCKQLFYKLTHNEQKLFINFTVKYINTTPKELRHTAVNLIKQKYDFR